MRNILNKVNTVVTAVTAIYTVTKFMIKTFKKYQEQHDRRSIQTRFQGVQEDT